MKLASEKFSGLNDLPFGSAVKMVFNPSTEGYCFFGKTASLSRFSQVFFQHFALDVAPDEACQGADRCFLVGIDAVHGFDLRFHVTQDDVAVFADVFSRSRCGGVLVNESELGQIRQNVHAALGVSAETSAITAVVPPVKNTNCTSSPFFSKIPASFATHAGSASPLMAL